MGNAVSVLFIAQKVIFTSRKQTCIILYGGESCVDMSFERVRDYPVFDRCQGSFNGDGHAKQEADKALRMSCAIKKHTLS